MAFRTCNNTRPARRLRQKRGEIRSANDFEPEPSGRRSCQKRKQWSEPARTSARVNPRALRRVNSFAKQFITFGGASTARGRRNKRSQLAFPRPGKQASI